MHIMGANATDARAIEKFEPWANILSVLIVLSNTHEIVTKIGLPICRKPRQPGS
jgi:hypothetical protein